MNALDHLKKALAKQEASKSSEHWNANQRLLRRLIAEETIDPTEVGITLSLAGRTAKDIEPDIENIKYRDAIRERIKAAAAASEKIAGAQAALDAIKAEKEKFVAEINPRIEAAAAVVTSLSSVISMANGAVINLRESCLDPGLKAELELVDQEARELHAEQERMQRCHPENRDQAFNLRAADISKSQNALAARRAEIITLQENQ